MDLFEQNGFHPRGDLGQNFLIDLNLIEYIVAASELTPQDVVLEVGAGTGGMTVFLAQAAAAVVSVEIDDHMHALATKATASYDNVTLLNIDALKNKNTLAPAVLDEVRAHLAEDPQRKLKLVANLPYSVATPVVSNLLATDIPWSAMVITIQLELAQRMRAKPGISNYGSLSVWLQSQCKVKLLKKLPPTVFWPRPKVDSAIVRLLPDPAARQRIANREFFHDFVRKAFHQRRKQLRSVLTGLYRKQLTKPEVDELLQSQKLKPGVRAEELDVDTLVALSAAIDSMLAAKGLSLDAMAEDQVSEADAADGEALELEDEADKDEVDG